MADAPLCSDGLRYGQAGSCMNVCGGKVPMRGADRILCAVRNDSSARVSVCRDMEDGERLRRYEKTMQGF